MTYKSYSVPCERKSGNHEEDIGENLGGCNEPTIERTDLSTGTSRLEDRRHLQCAQWTRASNVCVLDQPFMKGIAA
jgi:hypothetical protein